MASKSISKPVIIRGEATAERLLRVLEAGPTSLRIASVDAHEITGDEIKLLFGAKNVIPC